MTASSLWSTNLKNGLKMTSDLRNRHSHLLKVIFLLRGDNCSAIKSSPFNQSITTILMQNQPYMFLLTTVDPSLLGLLQFQPLSPVLSSPSLPLASTSHQITPTDHFQNLMLPITYTSFTYTYNSNQSQQQPFLPQQNPQKTQPTTASTPTFTPALPPTITNSQISEPSQCSIKLQESPSKLSSNNHNQNSYKNKSQTKVRSKQCSTDREYNPNKPQRHCTRKRIHENENRNVVPNEINQILSFIQKANKSGYLLSHLFQKFPHRQNYTISRFYLYQGILKDRVSHYTNQRSLKLINSLYEPECKIWPEDEQRYYNKLCRLLIRHFLLEDSIFIILTSKRMRKEKKIDHLRARREVARRVFQVMREGEGKESDKMG